MKKRLGYIKVSDYKYNPTQCRICNIQILSIDDERHPGDGTILCSRCYSARDNILKLIDKYREDGIYYDEQFRIIVIKNGEIMMTQSISESKRMVEDLQQAIATSELS